MSETFAVEFFVRDEKGVMAPLPGVVVRSVVAREAIGVLPELDVELACPADVDLTGVLLPGSDIGLVIVPDGAPPSIDPMSSTFEARGGRRFHGIVYRLATSLAPSSSASNAYRSYRLELASRFGKATLVTSHAVFVDRTLREIVEAKLGAYGFVSSDSPERSDYELHFEADAQQGLPKRALTVQYGESDTGFLSRLVQVEGISVFVEHGPSRDRLVVTDVPERFRPCEGAIEATFRGGGEALDVYAFEEVRSFAPNAYIVRGFDDQHPQAAFKGDQKHEGASFAGGVYDYGCADDAEHAVRLARIRSEESAARQTIYKGKSTYGAFFAGSRTTLVDHPSFPRPRGLPLLLTQVTHYATLPTPWEKERVASYSNEFVAVPGECRFRPARTTPLPRMPNVTTAVVQAIPGVLREANDAVLDDQGRYRIAFHFDTEPEANSVRSCPVRMAQPLAGTVEGMHFPLRPGTEVLVSFIDGHPDRPVIVGALPNVTHPSVIQSANAALHAIRTPNGAVIAFGRSR
jgi:type VI secretion system secreted protein VgrG